MVDFDSGVLSSCMCSVYFETSWYRLTACRRGLKIQSEERGAQERTVLYSSWGGGRKKRKKHIVYTVVVRSQQFLVFFNLVFNILSGLLRVWQGA